MADYEIVAIRQTRGDPRTHHIDAVQVGNSLFLVDQIIDWISDGTHRFSVHIGNKKVDVIVREQESTGRTYLTTQGGGFPPVVLLSLPRIDR